MSAEESREPTETITRELALAIQLVDVHTGQPFSLRQVRSVAARSVRERRDSWRGTASDVPTVSISDVEAAPIVNLSGYLLYFRTDLPEDQGEIEVGVKGGERYADEQVSIDLSGHDRREPVRIDLHPLPAYRFPAGTTLVRGYVFVVDEEIDDESDIDPAKFGEEGVNLVIEAFGSATETTRNGEFVLSVTGITADDVDDGLVQVNGDDPTLDIELQHDEFEDASIPVEVSEGETRCYHIRVDANEDEAVTYRECGEKPWTNPTP